MTAWGYPFPTQNCGCCGGTPTPPTCIPRNVLTAPCDAAFSNTQVLSRRFYANPNTGSGTPAGFPADWYNTYSFDYADAITAVPLLTLTYQGITAAESYGYWEGSTTTSPGEPGFADTWNVRIRPLTPPTGLGQGPSASNSRGICGEHWLSSNPTVKYGLQIGTGADAPYLMADDTCYGRRIQVGTSPTGSGTCGQSGNMVGKGLPIFLTQVPRMYSYTISGFTHTLGTSVQDYSGTYTVNGDVILSNTGSTVCSLAGALFNRLFYALDVACSYSYNNTNRGLLILGGCVSANPMRLYGLSGGTATAVAFQVGENNNAFIDGVGNYRVLTIQYSGASSDNPWSTGVTINRVTVPPQGGWTWPATITRNFVSY